MTGWMESLAGRLSLPARHAWRLELLAATGALIGIVVTALLSGLVARAAFPLIVAPIGASAVLLFAVPASPLAQPWSIVGGNTVSALVGVGVSMLVPNVALAAGMAVALAIAVMVLTRSLHPPGGAAALTAVLVHPSSAGLSAGLLFPFLPVALNSVVLVAVGLLFHTLTRRRYPHGAPPPVARPASSVATAPLAPPSAAPAPIAATPGAATSRAAISGGSTLGGSTSGGTISGPAAPAPLTLADIEAALAAMDDTFDIDPDDLRQLLNLAEQNARRRSAHSRNTRHSPAARPDTRQYGPALPDVAPDTLPDASQTPVRRRADDPGSPAPARSPSLTGPDRLRLTLTGPDWHARPEPGLPCIHLA